MERLHAPPEPGTRSGGPLLWLAVAGFVAFLLATSQHPDYGWFLDEMYYLACAARPALGYPDHPPLAPLLLAAHRAVLGDSLLLIRVWPALCAAATMLLAARVAWRLGGGLGAQLLSVLCIATAPVLLGIFSIFSVNSFDVLLWTAALAALVEICLTDDRRGWWIVGIALGLGLLSKHTIGVLAAAIAIGTLLTRLRVHLRTRELWLGVGLCLLIAAPNLWWQVQNDFVSLELYASAERDSNIETSILGVLDGQLGGFNPAAFPVWLAGLYLLLASPRRRALRAVGLAAAVLFAVLLLGGRSRPDRIMGVYPLLFAVGGVQLQTLWSRRGFGWLRFALPMLIAAIGVVSAFLVVPVLDPETAAAFKETLGDDTEIHKEVGHARLLLPLAHRRGNQEVTDLVTRAWRGLAREQRAGTIILAEGYAPASAIELLGPADLPDVYSPHQSYFLWGPPPSDPERVIAVGFEPAQLDPYFARVEVVERAPCKYCMGWRQDMPIAIASAPRRSLQEAWPELRRFGYSIRKHYLVQQADRATAGATRAKQGGLRGTLR